MLDKKLLRTQWIAVVVLFIGVVLVDRGSDVGEEHDETHSTGVHVHETHPAGVQQNYFVGLVAVLTMTLTSGFAGVFTEKQLKKGSPIGYCVRNIYLSSFALLFSLVFMWVMDGKEIAENGFFFGFTPSVWFAVSMLAVAGLIVSVVVRYADTILKIFAISLSTLICCLASVWSGMVVTAQFVAGTLLVFAAVFLYSAPEGFITKFLPKNKPSATVKKEWVNNELEYSEIPIPFE